MSATPGQKPWIHRILAGLLALWVVVCGALAADDALHRRLHGDADDGDAPDHDDGCALCHFVHGTLDAATPAPDPVPVHGDVIAAVPVPVTPLVPAEPAPGVPTRGPPVRIG